MGWCWRCGCYSATLGVLAGPQATGGLFPTDSESTADVCQPGAAGASARREARPIRLLAPIVPQGEGMVADPQTPRL
jgi:hypothetical protein